MKNRSISRNSLVRLFVLAVIMMVGNIAMAQKTISGKVLDNQGQPLMGVVVQEEGTATGTTTDMDGRFRLDQTKNGSKFEISLVGFVSKKVKPTNGMEIVLLEDEQVLNEVVVVGYGSMRRKDVTSSITTVNADQLNKGAYSDPAQLLAGKVAGLVVTDTGNPSGEPSISLRGSSSLRTGVAQQPYYVIDGVPGVDLSLVSPDDIESIDVLRDASATAIYGSKAANGIIIITTKKGKKEKTNITYNGYVGFDSPLKKLDMMSAADMRAYGLQHGINLTDEGANTNWQDEVMRTGINHSHNLNINGGHGKTTYNASLTFMKREGVVKMTDNQRINGRVLLQTSLLKDHLDMALGVNISQGKFSSVLGRGDGASVLDAMTYYSPLLPIRNADGSFYEYIESKYYNPISMLNEDRFDNERRRTQFTAKATLNILKGLTATANYSYSQSQNLFSSYHTTQSQVVKTNGQATRNTYQGDKSQFEGYVNYTKTFAQAHKMDLMGGYSWEQESHNDGFGLTVTDFYDDTLTYHNLTNASKIDGIDGIESGAESTLRMISFYGRANYSYNSRYMAQATVRRDGSSAFGINNRWATFPSGSLAWRISEEPFMKGASKTIDDLKLRVGYGVSGNSLGFNSYTAIKTYGASGWFTYINEQGETVKKRTLAATSNANPDLKWEKTSMFNVGADIALWGGRLSGTIEYYIKHTSDLIHAYAVSTNRYPYPSMVANVGQINNSGVEVTISATPIKTNRWSWTTSINLSHNQNKVVKLSNQDYSVDYIDSAQLEMACNNGSYVQRIMEGQPLGTFYTWEFAGYMEKDGQKYSCFYEHDAETNKRIPDANDPTGWKRTTDTNDKDRTKVGCAQPKLTFGWNNTLSYRRWTLTMFFQGMLGNKVYNATRAQLNSISLIEKNKNVLKELATMQVYGDVNSQVPSDRYLENGSYIRLSTLSLSFNVGKIGDWIKNINIYGTANNVFTITKYTGLDPEVSLGGIDPGVEYRQTYYPHRRSITVGAKINF